MKNLARSLAVCAAVAVVAPVASASASDGVRVLAPAELPAPGKVRFTAEAPSSTERVAFYVDGVRRSVDRSPSWRCGAVHLAAGRHMLKIRAIEPGHEAASRIVTAWQSTYVADPDAAPPRRDPNQEPASVRGEQSRIPTSPPPSEPRGEYEPEPESPEVTPEPETVPEPDPSQPSGLLFAGRGLDDFELQDAPGAMTEVPDPAGSGETVLEMTVNDHDVAPITPTENPRAQAVGPSILRDGEEVWLKTKFLIPADYPSVPGWLSLVSLYGPPYNGSSPWHIGVNDNELRWQRNGTYDWDIPWRASFQQAKGRWTTVLVHELFARDGWVEMWIDGEQITFFPKGNYNPLHEPETSRLAMETMDDSNDGGANSPRLTHYRELGMFSEASLYFGAMKLGTTRASVGG